jgi:Second Messenger Oligonucleotide or Dinucleotide Synthetase domain
MFDQPRRSLRQPLSEPVDLLLADVAIRVQLTRTDHAKAEQRYEALGDHLDRDGSLIQGRVELIYPQGSMAIGATIASRLTTDEYDVDFIAQLNLPRAIAPQTAIDLLFHSIRGKPGSRYHDMAERRTRCVTVHYADKMHADITPVILLPEREERTSLVFHSPDDPREPDLTLIANPWGFAQWFKRTTPPDHEFARLFAERAAEHEYRVLAEEAESEELPTPLPPHQKSKALIVLQLLKRWRNVRYDTRRTRRPPSIMMAKLIADAANSTDTLSEELLHQGGSMLDVLRAEQRAGRKIEVRNPECEEDILTDRWPASLQEQNVFIRDLEDLVAKVERLIAGCPLDEMRVIMTDLFGEGPAEQAFRAFNERFGNSIRQGRSRYSTDGGRLSLPGSGLVAGAAAPLITRASPPHTFYGTERRRR